MSRIPRVVVPEVAHHVTQRGNRGMDVFRGAEDASRYLDYLSRHAEACRLDVWAYCLMTNHVHLIVVPHTEQSLPMMLHNVHSLYARWFNARTAQSGHVWQSRYYSCPMDEPHLWAAVRYVERNPVRAGIVARAEAYRWSSARAHCGIQADPLLSKGFPPDGVVQDWSAWLLEEEAAATETVRHNTKTGRPCGGPEFLGRLEALLARPFHLARRGPKRRKF